MRRNRNGFMLVEVIIASTVIVTAMIGLYTSYNKTYKNYERRNNYYHVDAMYASKEMVRYLLENDQLNQLINQLPTSQEEVNNENNQNVSTESIIYLIKNSTCEAVNDQFKNNFCSPLQTLYGVKNMILADYDKSVLQALPVENETFKEYINFIIGYYNIEDANINVSEESNTYQYVILTELEEGENLYYANLVIR